MGGNSNDFAWRVSALYGIKPRVFVTNQRYKQAALAYLVYGIIYLCGAIYLANLGLSERGSMEGGAWVWYVVGGLFVCVFPYVIWREVRWFTLVLATFMLFRVYELIRMGLNDQQSVVPMPWGGEMTRSTGAFVFALVAVLAMCMLLRAALVPRNDNDELNQQEIS